MKQEIHGSTDVTSHFIKQAWVLAMAMDWETQVVYNFFFQEKRTWIRCDEFTCSVIVNEIFSRSSCPAHIFRVSVDRTMNG